ncbi:MAG TPA: hypothetical protein VND40_04030 [Nitrososphaerales archaeon]|nr:hypothetical protein [Nitrososphaerales archaeon]
MPTKSHTPRRSKSKQGSGAQGNPIKGIRLDIILIGAAGRELERLAVEKGMAVREKGDDLSVTLTAASPEDALAQLRLLTGLLARKG